MFDIYYILYSILGCYLTSILFSITHTSLIPHTVLCICCIWNMHWCIRFNGNHSTMETSSYFISLINCIHLWQVLWYHIWMIMCDSFVTIGLSLKYLLGKCGQLCRSFWWLSDQDCHQHPCILELASERALLRPI